MKWKLAILSMLLLPAPALVPPPATAGTIYSSSVCAPYYQQQIIYRDRYVYVPQVQQYVAVPVQPYYASWNSLYGTVPSATPSPQPAANTAVPSEQHVRPNVINGQFSSPYLTREEFLAA